MELAILLVFAAALYVMPAAVAFDRTHRNALAILVVNVLLGWTVLGWVGALLWAQSRPGAPGGRRSAGPRSPLIALSGARPFGRSAVAPGPGHA